MEKILGNKSPGLVFIISAPAGTGKTTLVEMLVKEFPCVVQSVSFTTRHCRPGEIPGVHYHFVTDEEFERKIANGEMLEYVKLYGYYYGTDYRSVREQQNLGKHVVLVIDTQGALQLKNHFQAVYIFLKPPSLEVLRGRLTGRKTEKTLDIEERLSWAQKELEVAHEYDYCILNEDLETSYEILRSIFIAEEHKNF